ncbi:uncharacterized protein TNCT_451541 [Trichonephila clavata]|uniref:DNA-directed DNA polymerase n=1 Tax=Trichonephila clavata TaxID=2740835 RepID=A0A8X6F2B2_TRICU|nr:uncharacterized protein TNCT_451541 [Trichonephila clavata]
MPAIGENIIKFSNFAKSSYHPFSIYTDFECMLIPISTSMPSTSTSFTCAVEQHVPYSYSMLCLDFNDRIIFHHYYCRDDAVENFLHKLKQLCSELLYKMHRILPMAKCDKPCSTKCHICGKKFLKNDKIVRDHNHFTSVFRGYAHNKCNLLYRKTFFIPVIIHNLRGYDSHLILQKLSSKYAKSISIIPVNSQNFTTFQIDQIKFLDSFQFLSTSLATLVENLVISNHSFPIFNEFYSNEKNKFLLKRKGIFPYSYFSSPAVLNQTCLPLKEAFYNALTNSHITNDEYNFAQLIFRSFRCKTFGDYLKLYQQLDVILLAEVFTSFRQKCMAYYNLDPCHFITAADLTWNAGLNFTKVELEIFTDANMYLWIENNIRGGICYIGKRYSCSNNPFVPETFDPKREESYIIAVDANNLYGYTMTQSLPINTESLYLEIRTSNVYTDLKTTFNSIMDLSNFPTDHELFSSQNKGVLGALKCETASPIKEFIALKCKMYCLVYCDGAKKTAKGVKKEQELIADTESNRRTTLEDFFKNMKMCRKRMIY